MESASQSGSTRSGRHDKIAVDGKTVEAEKKIYLMLNKPRA